jgi:hypothetical protein
MIAEKAKTALIHSLLVRGWELVVLKQPIKLYSRTRARKPHLKFIIGAIK